MTTYITNADILLITGYSRNKFSSIIHDKYLAFPPVIAKRGYAHLRDRDAVLAWLERHDNNLAVNDISLISRQQRKTKSEERHALAQQFLSGHFETRDKKQAYARKRQESRCNHYGSLRIAVTGELE